MVFFAAWPEKAIQFLVARLVMRNYAGDVADEAKGYVPLGVKASCVFSYRGSIVNAKGFTLSNGFQAAEGEKGVFCFYWAEEKTTQTPLKKKT